MSYQRLLQQIVGVALITLILVGCGAPAVTLMPTATPTVTSIPTSTPTPTITPIPTPTPIPLPEVTGVLTGRALGERPGPDRLISYTFRGEDEDEEVDYEGGEPLAQARVVLCQFTDEKICTVQPHLTALTDEEGVFHITDVRPGRYAVLYNGSGKEQTEWGGLEIDFTVEEKMTVLNSIFRSLDVETLSACALYAVGMIQFSGYLYSEDFDLAFVLIDDEPVSVDVQTDATIDLSVWSTRGEECEIPNTLSLQENKVNIDH
jgi:hypothetical protein